MTNHEPMDFDDLAPQSVAVTIKGQKYVLREATEEAARQYRNAQYRSMKMGPDGKPSSLDGMADTGSILVSGCLFAVTATGESPVPLTAVRLWPARIVGPLFERAKFLSNLDQDLKAPGEKEEALKNGSSATTATSV